ncbi:hypothetical protein BXZ70DRAFT_1063907 [Cristinia sonorae]|uniref:Uncharacterized protein n=1 Tax=Cristinia sonorae TaxID=1940300 RepID=A0A8K0XR04_9AGAR|nr:hypothetical protein BXZ70DRAFT_1063907 [Cristinia sonorae]
MDPPRRRLASSKEFTAWKAEAGLVVFNSPRDAPSDVVSLYKRLSIVRLPRELSKLKQDATRNTEDFMEFIANIQEWYKSSGSIEKSSADPNQIMLHLPHLFRIFRHLCRDSVFEDISYLEAEVDSTLRLCHTERSCTTGAQADHLLVIQCPKLSCDLVQCAKSNGKTVPKDVLEEGSWEDSGVLHSIIALPLECGRGDTDRHAASNQLHIDFVTAQNQRRALGLSDQPIFGLVLDDGSTQIWSSAWINDYIHVYPHTKFSLSSAREFISLFSFLSNLRAHIATLYEDLESIDINKAIQTLHAHAWRAEEAPYDDVSVEEIEDYHDEDDSVEVFGKAVANTVTRRRVSPLDPGSRGGGDNRKIQHGYPPGILVVLKHWVKTMVLYYLGVVGAMIHVYLQ